MAGSTYVPTIRNVPFPCGIVMPVAVPLIVVSAAALATNSVDAAAPTSSVTTPRRTARRRSLSMTSLPPALGSGGLSCTPPREDRTERHLLQPFSAGPRLELATSTHRQAKMACQAVGRKTIAEKRL